MLRILRARVSRKMQVRAFSIARETPVVATGLCLGIDQEFRVGVGRAILDRYLEWVPAMGERTACRCELVLGEVWPTPVGR